MQHPASIKIENTLKTIFDSIDDYLEDKYGSSYPLHPARAERGTTSNKMYDGLFTVGAKYSAGFGSEHGPGYTVDVRISTLDHIPSDIRQSIHQEVIVLLKKSLDRKFPMRKLEVSLDGNVYKIHGDLSLGEIK